MQRQLEEAETEVAAQVVDVDSPPSEVGRGSPAPNISISVDPQSRPSPLFQSDELLSDVLVCCAALSAGEISVDPQSPPHLDLDDLLPDTLVDDCGSPASQDLSSSRLSSPRVEPHDEAPSVLSIDSPTPPRDAKQGLVIISAPDEPARRSAGELAIVMSGAGINNLCDESTWVPSDFLNAALGRICDSQGAHVNSIDSIELGKMADEYYKPRPRVARGVSEANITLLPLFINANHWVLAVVHQLSSKVATSIELFDSMSSAANARKAQQQVNAFVRSYLPRSSPLQTKVVRCASAQQQNSDDCGVFAFFFALCAIAKRSVPACLHAKLWRHLMAACLGGTTEG